MKRNYLMSVQIKVYSFEQLKMAKPLECGGLTPLSPTLSLSQVEGKSCVKPQHSKISAIFTSEGKALALLNTYKILLGVVIVLMFLLNVAQAQRPKPSPTPAPKTSEELGDYNITSSIEFGVRGISVDGSDNKYRSDLNYKQGFRVFDSGFLMKAKNGKGKLFDNLLVMSSGFVADPDGFTRINANKIGWYRFDANVRRFTYFNSLNNLALGQHTSNTKRTLGDFDLTILPENERIKFRMGYAFNRNGGQSVTTYQYQINEFPILSNVKYRSDEFRGGVDAKVFGIDLTFMQGFQRFNDNTSFTINSPQSGNSTPGGSLATFQRVVPTVGHNYYSRFGVHTLVAKRLDFTGRLVYSGSTSTFNLIESLTGRDFVGNIITSRRLNVSGDSKQPNVIYNVGVTIFATGKLKISNMFDANSYRVTGGNVLGDTLLRQNIFGFPIPPVITNTLSHRLNNYRRFANTIEADYQFSKNYALHVGYRYADRRIVLDEFDRNFAQPNPVNPAPYEFNNRTNTIFFGGQIRPVQQWTAYFDVEHGGADYVFTRTDNYKFTNFRIRNRIMPTDNLAINFSVLTKDNNNPTVTTTNPAQSFGVDVNNRIYTSSIDWSPIEKLSFSGGYTYQHLTSDAVIIFPINLTNRIGRSRYFIRDRYFFVDAFVMPHPRITFFASYHYDKDKGQKDRVSTSPEFIIGSYPLQFRFPEVRVAVKLHKRVDWNVGYKFYDYKERFQTAQDYRAHLPYTSLRIYFGRER